MDNFKIRMGGVLASSCANAEITDGMISPTIMARAGTGGNQLPLEDGICQTLTARCGTGGGHVPMILMFDGERRHNYEMMEDGIAPTVLAQYGTGGGNTPIILERLDERENSVSEDNRSVVRE